MLNNERGSLLVDALIALLLVSCMIALLTSAYSSYVKHQRVKQSEVNVYEVFEEATRIYDD